MTGKKKQYISNLEEIMRALADVWPADRTNIAVAGAKYEKIIGDFDKGFGQLQKLIDLAWDGLMYLYEKDEYFMSVKQGTLQAVNTIREYVISDGNIAVEDFEKAYFDLDKALRGGTESADTVIELDDEALQKLTEADEGQKNTTDEVRRESKDESGSYSLDDLAAFIMMLNEDSITSKELGKLKTIIQYLVDISDDAVKKPISKCIPILEASSEGWLKTVSEFVEEAIKNEEDEEWKDINENDKDAPEEAVKKYEEESDAVEEVFRIPEDVELSMIGEFVAECADLIEMAESALLELEESPNNDELINTVFRAFHTIKGTSAFMGLDPISEFTHSVETLLSMVREGELPFDVACADITFKSIDIIKQMLRVVESVGEGDPLPKPQGYDRLIEVLGIIADEGKAPAEAITQVPEEAPVADAIVEEAREIVEEAEGNGNTDGAGSKSEVESSVRVSVGRLDRLIDMVGELVIAHSVVAQDKVIPKDSELQKKVNHTSKILRELQDTSLTLRMVPLKATFHKMNRLVRDIARKSGKSVKLSTFGEDTEIDRNMVDIISEPLVHMLRNAIDHGIEEPEKRDKSGKDATACISLRASQEGGKVVIEIEDDGRGIDKDIIFDKAVTKGLVDPDKKLTDKEIYDLIFLPGFSSVEKVTDLSGRGVGMDVVRRAIEQLQGKIEVSSELGKGTRFIIELPFTLAITDGMLVKVGSERFIIPTINIDMTFRAQQKDLFTVLGHSEQVSFRGESVPVIRLHRLFDIADGTSELLEGTLLVIKSNNKRYALLVDEVIGQQQLVGKSINMLVKMHHISGGAILGDGRVGLILDTATLMN